MTKDWNRFKSQIEVLYIRERRSLKEVRHHMHKQHDFFASTRAYRIKLDAWGFRKNRKLRDGTSTPPKSPTAIVVIGTPSSLEAHRESASPTPRLASTLTSPVHHDDENIPRGQASLVLHSGPWGSSWSPNVWPSTEVSNMETALDFDNSAANSLLNLSRDQPQEVPSLSIGNGYCPMCRRPTTASLNTQLAEQLSARYPLTYSERRADEQASETDGSESAVKTLTLYIGNKHRLIRPAENSSNRHEWTFFVRPSRTDIIKEVQIFIHPTFRPSRIIRTSPPYEIRRIGWGYFTVTAQVILRAGYTWVSENTETAPDRTRKRILSLDWNLDFDGFGGRGSMGRCRLKVRNETGREDMDVVEGNE